ncbi:uncharacterized protein LOC124658800 [Lolium rigidum]|uniref:uncharacterized protein LOC124658800 n=1 Tax=Lolium rigidum TaxID=89674 RepID=UPI001F5DE270|nr:uncharacterized protein LOC124658800 [Lolium rigidum]
MGDAPKSSSARRSWHTLFPDDAPTPTAPSSPPPALRTLPQSQSATNLISSPQLINKSPGQKMDEAKASQQPRAGDPSANEVVQEVEASANDRVQEEKEAPKTDLPASGPESTPLDVAAGDKKKAVAKGKVAGIRIWSVEDEFGILESLAAFVKAYGKPPGRSQLCEVVREHVVDKKEFTKTQIYEKVRGLRNKYYTMRTTAAASGAPPPGDADDLRKYDLSSKIWGDSLMLPKREIKENSSGQPLVRRKFEELRDMYPHLTLMVEEIAGGDRCFLKRAFEFIDDDTAHQLDAKLKKQRILKMKIHQDRTSITREVLSTLVEYMT